MSTDRIEKKILLRAPLGRVWMAVSDAEEFGRWFGMKFDSPFVVNEVVRGQISPTQVDPVVGAMQQAHEGKSFEIRIEAIEPMRRFAMRWHPYAVDENVDYSNEPMTLVSFELEPVEGGVMLTVVESGFDQIPLERRAKAFEANDGGWTVMVGVIVKYVRTIE